LFNDPEAWQNMPLAAQTKTLRDAHEWDVIMTTGVLFPAIEPESIRKIRTPVLLISGAKSFHFLSLIDDELARLLPNSQHLIVPDAGHDMWVKAPELCRTRVEQLLK